MVRTAFEPVWLFRSSALPFGVANHRFGLHAFLIRSRSFLAMRKVCAFIRLVSWLLSFDHDIPHECKTANLTCAIVIDVRNLSRLGFVSMSDFLGLAWRKVRIELTVYKGSPH